jgi:hypothetical protein
MDSTAAMVTGPDLFSSIAESVDQDDVEATSVPPSHILQDGRFVHLPPPTNRERSQFFERSIARHGLLEADLSAKKKAAEEEVQVEKDQDKNEPKVHPLAMASAKLQANGISELNRAINLSTLVMTGEYFSLSNIVDPSLEISSTERDANTVSASANSTAVSPTATSIGTPQTEALRDEQRVKSGYVLKRKRAHFEAASVVLERHRRRLAAAIVAQAQPEARLRALRPTWRLVAPEHGTRALPHATRSTELVACDVDVYWKGGDTLGRLASRVPRYATMELKEDFDEKHELDRWMKDTVSSRVDAMDVDSDSSERKTEKLNVPKQNDPVDEMDTPDEANEYKSSETQKPYWTRAEPFAIADPTLGKLDAHFDPTKVAMLSLQFDIEKASTSFCKSASLEPIAKSTEDEGTVQEDEQVLAALQHSLFCAKLFESIRRELAPDTEDVGQVRASAATASSVVWLNTQSEESFLPAPSHMANGGGVSGLAPLCVVYCHEGEVKVQLDQEYTLCVKLVEAGQAAKGNMTSDDSAMPLDSLTLPSISGSQSPAQLSALCRTLLLHAQESYHIHSLKLAAAHSARDIEAAKLPNVHVRQPPKLYPRILQRCVSLGAKLLLERRIRHGILQVKAWQQKTFILGEPLAVEWLSLSVFDLHSHFCVTYRGAVLDVHLSSDEICVTSFGEDGDYRKVHFYGAPELELFLKGWLRRVHSSAGN